MPIGNNVRQSVTIDLPVPPDGDSAGLIQNALNEASEAGGGMVRLGPGFWFVGTSISVPSKVTLEGCGRRATTLYRTADVVVLDVSGTHPNTTTTSTKGRVTIRNLGLHGDGFDNPTWIQPLLRTYYCATLMLHEVDFQYCYAVAWRAVELWDSYVTKCRWDECGGQDGNSPAVYFHQRTNATSGFGHSTDSVNNVYFDQCVWEGFYDGAFWSDGTGGVAANELMRFNQCKFETYNVRDAHLFFGVTNHCQVKDTHFQVTNFADGYSTPANHIWVIGCYNITFEDILIRNSQTSTSVTRTGVRMDTTENCTLRNVYGEFSNTTTDPTVALVEWVNTNRRVRKDNIRYMYWTEGVGSTVESGTPTDTV